MPFADGVVIRDENGGDLERRLEKLDEVGMKLSRENTEHLTPVVSQESIDSGNTTALNMQTYPNEKASNT